ncbi:unnamed protein product [Strongylus vulgaris]|uniref:Aminopeptidase N-like N-terminal domain-containing protein n=1 Tax=Strongylus vulgaris TaxID=40348 RepID=A0A3P7KWR9_STRVU|nr:unnamed protein product [Strongylus vulgaris]
MYRQLLGLTFIFQISEEFPQLLDIYALSDLIPERDYSLVLEFKTATHLQPQEARSLFPCIDSPEAKARFEAVIVHPAGTYALFNMKETNITTRG